MSTHNIYFCAEIRKISIFILAVKGILSRAIITTKMNILETIFNGTEPQNSSRKKQKFNGIRNAYMQRGSVSGPCPASIDACTTSGHTSNCAVSK